MQISYTTSRIHYLVRDFPTFIHILLYVCAHTINEIIITHVQVSIDKGDNIRYKDSAADTGENRRCDFKALHTLIQH